MSMCELCGKDEMCMIDSCDETFAVLDYKRISKARAEHTCTECRRTIHKGEIYHLYSGLIRCDGWSHHPTCNHCYSAPIHWLMENCHGFVHTTVMEDIEQHCDEALDGVYPPGEVFWLMRCYIGMRDKWKDGTARIPAQRPKM